MDHPIELQLVPAPGQKPEFLATLEPALSSSSSSTASSLWSKLATIATTTTTTTTTSSKRVVILEGYTRDTWALSAATSNATATATWQNLTVQSIDGRHKLPGFVTYLQQRNKAAYGRFTTTTSTATTTKSTGVWVVLPQKQKDGGDVMSCWIALDIRRIPNCSLIVSNSSSNNNNTGGKLPSVNPNEKNTTTKSSASQPSLSSSSSRPAVAANANAASSSSSSSNPLRKGFLGNLVGAQRRTNQHMSNAPAKKPDKVVDNDDINGSGGGAVEGRSVTQVLDDFRQTIEQKLLDFDTEEHETTLDIPIRHVDYIHGLALQEERAKVSMEVLKYLVQEQAEEINEEWVVYQPPSEFLDEITLTIYKEAPPEILEEMNQGILPDEIRQQQRAIQSERQRLVNQVEAKRQAELRNQALRQAHAAADDDDDDGGGANAALARLNTVKRDRRTVEDFQRGTATSSSSPQAKKSKSG